MGRRRLRRRRAEGRHAAARHRVEKAGGVEARAEDESNDNGNKLFTASEAEFCRKSLEYGFGGC